MTSLRKLLLVGVICLFQISGYMMESGSKALVWSDEERVYELKLTRILNSKGSDILVKVMQEEHARNPRPWTKAWLAYYSIHAAAFNVKPTMDPSIAWRWIEEAKQEACVFAYTAYGAGLLDGKVPGQPKNLAEGARLVMLASQAGHPTSMITAAHCTFFGQGVPKDRKAAIDWARRASYANATMALAQLADYYAGGVYVVPADKAKAAQLYYEAALHERFLTSKPLDKLAKEGVKAAEKYQRMVTLDRLLKGAQYTNATVRDSVQWLEENCADEPDALTVVAAARMNKKYQTYDIKKVTELLQRAVALGWDDASYYQAHQQLFGIGMPKDEAAALAAIQALASKGNAKALGRLGWAYYWGPYKRLGMEKNAAQAFLFTLAAAEQGDWFGLLNAGFCYKHGIGTEESNELAYWYFGLAGSCGSVEGKEQALRLQPFLAD